MKEESSSLVDSFGRAHDYLRISVTDKCNLRCRYCMPKNGLRWKRKDELLTNEEISRLARLFISLGIKKIRLTGGEPFLREDIDDLLQSLAELKNDTGLEVLAVTTNGTLLSPKLSLLKGLGIEHLNISLDTLRADRFLALTNRDQFNQVWQTVQQSIALGFNTLKLNVVMISSFNEDEILDFAALAYENHINVRFIEFMPFKDNNWQVKKVLPYQQMKKIIEAEYKLMPVENNPSAVAKDFTIVDGKGSVSFITSMTESFCSTCNRLRITADGHIKSCLFFPAENSLRSALRMGANNEELIELIYQALKMKPQAHPPAHEIAANLNRAMIEIGG